ncbi:MAG TPA: carbohydrate porin [Gallionellaceae bacterium]|nr:carbohydrate porin [Gallionellaceae bacterium]
MLAVIALWALPWTARADDGAPPEDWNAKFQSTYIWQHQPSFNALYSGINSLPTHAADAYTFSFTAAFGKRLWDGAEAYFDPEAIQGAPLSPNLVGFGGFYNGELTRVSGAHLTIYRARLFIRQTWGQGGGREDVPSAMNQLGGAVDRNRIVLTAGNFAVLDIFDNNRYAHDPRTQFMNWCNMASCAFDYPADTRGYTWGFALEDYEGGWVYRFGQFMQPRYPNGLALDGQFFRHYGQVFEIVHAHVMGGREGKVRLLAYRDAIRAGSYYDAMASPAFATDSAAGIPATAAVRRDAVKYGLGYNVEQSIAADVGLFSRAMWQDGRYETYAFTAVHRSFSVGVALGGRRWMRDRDTAGVAYLRNALSGIYRQYLAAGGLGYFIGDGKLNYADEQIVEAYYSIGVGAGASVTADYQYIRAPAYNADRGPLAIVGARLHWEN